MLLPDPALSTGYGLDFVNRGWNAWGQAPYTDLMAITDAVEARADIDETRTAAMGGSFGGYMANWVAGHTDRFRAIVTHASLWALDQFNGTTDSSQYWQSIFDADGMRGERPAPVRAPTSRHRCSSIHGDKDYRVPIGEGLRLWSELAEHHAAPDGTMPHRFLYFPDENHWVLTPQHAVVWYETVFAFLGAARARPGVGAAGAARVALAVARRPAAPAVSRSAGSRRAQTNAACPVIARPTIRVLTSRVPSYE